MRTMKLFVVLIVVAVASLLSVPVAFAAPKGPQSVLTYTAPYKIKLYKEDFDCKIASHKFDKVTGVGTVTFNGRLTTIGSGTFRGYRSLTSITIPDGVTAIGQEAFVRCSSLKSITISDSVTWIGYCAFDGCSSLTSITIPDSVTAIGENAFYGCYALKDVNINITDLAKYCTNNDIHNIPGNNHLFIDNKEITELVIPDSVTSIGEWPFYGCSSLTSITIPDSVTKIGEGAFSGCSSLTSITIPDSVNEIGYKAFDGCSNIEEITTERWIGYAFNNFAGLKRINGKEIINDGSFKFVGDKLVWVDRGLSSVSIPATIKSIHPKAFVGCKNIENVNVADLNLWLRSGVDMSSSDGWSLYHNGKLVTNVTIPNGVTEIARGQFCDNKSLTSITIPNSVTTIGNIAFYGCSSLYSVTIGNGVTKIGDYAFKGCSSLGSITIPASVKEIGESAFYNCSSLTSVTIPNSVINICTQAFYGCSELNEVTIPASVKTLGKYVFGGYAGNLTVYMQGVNPPALVEQFFDWSGNFMHRIYKYDIYGNYDIEDIIGITFKLYVPKNALYNYKTADFWKDLEPYISTKN